MTKREDLLPDLVCSQHMREFLDRKMLPAHIDYAIETLKRKRFDSLAFRGFSGAIIAPPVAVALNKQLLLVRKSTEDTHSDFLVEGNPSVHKYIIIDDFMSSGKTAKAIIELVAEFAPQAKCMGFLSVQHHYYYSNCKLGCLVQHSGWEPVKRRRTLTLSNAEVPPGITSSRGLVDA